MTVKNLYPNIRPSLDLNFAATKRLDPRITFSRASAGTYVDAAGLIKSAAVNEARFDHSPTTGESLGLLVEEARTNSFTYSHYLDDATWTKTNTQVIPNALLAPDNTFTGMLLNSQAAGSANVNRAFTRSNPAFTAFIKAGSSSTANLKIQSDVVGRNVSYNVNLSTGVLTAGTGNTGNIAGWTEYTSITAMSNGWYRVFIGFSSSTGTVNSTYSVSPCANGSAAAANESIYVWGAQLEAGSFPTSYIPTPASFTSRASTATFYDSAGIVQTAASGVARSAAFFPDQNGIFRPAGLLLEAAGTNLLNHSQTFATSGGTQNDWADTNITRDGTLRTSPDGTANALRITASAANATVISSSGIGTSAARSLSVFLRRVTGSGAVEYTLDNGSTYTPQAISSSWVRYAFPVTTADQQVGIRLVTSGDAIELWGAQLEAGASATSYIPTTTATVTRAADVSSSATVTRSADVVSITGANFSSWYNNNEGTWLTDMALGFTNNAGNPFVFGGVNFTTVVDSVRTLGNSGVMGGLSNSLTVPSKTAVALKSQDFRVYRNGTQTGSNNELVYTPSGTQWSINSSLGSLGRIKRVTYWPTRLSDATLQTITT
jgi:hypothetical protein